MATHDAMWTAHFAAQLRAVVKNDPALKGRLTRVENQAVDASSAGAAAAMAMFDALEVAMKSDDPKVVALAKKIHDGPFNTIIA